MKNLLMVVSALTLFSTSAFASQARLLALGMKETDNEGMYYVEDSRNIFLNPAYVNLYPSYATVEFGSVGNYASVGAAAGATSKATVNSQNNTKAQGGVFTKAGGLVYGAYYGNESNTSSLLRIAGSSGAATINGTGGGNSTMLQTADNQIDVFVGGDNGIKWGANALYAGGKDNAASSKDSAVAIRGGLISNSWDAHINLSLNSKSEATTTVTPLAQAGLAESVNQEFKGKLGFQVGGSGLISGNNRLYGYVKHYGWEQSDSYSKYTALDATIGAIPTALANFGNAFGQQGTVKGDFTSYYFGWATHMDVNTSDRVYFALSAKKTDINVKFANKVEVRHLVVPFTLGYEAKANEWLTLRGSIIQNIWGKSDNKNSSSINPVARSLISGIYQGDGKKTVPTSTEVNAGATLTWGQLAVDGLIGLTPASRASTANNQKSTTGVLALDNLSSSVAVTYKF